MMTPAHAPRWMKATLVMSLALNMLLGGLVLGRFFLSPFNAFSAKPDINMAVLVERLTDGMTEADQRVMRSAVEQRQAALINQLNAVRAAKAHLKDTVLSDNPSKDQLRAALGQLSTAADDMRLEVIGLMVETMPNLSLEGRSRIMRVIEAPGGRGGPPWRR